MIDTELRTVSSIGTAYPHEAERWGIVIEIDLPVIA